MPFSAIGGYCSRVYYYSGVYKETFVYIEYSAATPRNPPLTVIKMVYIRPTPLHINLYADRSYLTDVDLPSPRLY